MGNVFQTHITFETQPEKKKKKKPERRRNSLAFYISLFVKTDGTNYYQLMEEVKVDRGTQIPKTKSTARDFSKFVSWLVF
jgi:hypothetical protein